jgi:coenzyme F420 hydrogenase subunit beta
VSSIIARSTPPHRNLCTDCGVSRTSAPERCASACQFIRPDYPSLETRHHGRQRDLERPDELFFGVFKQMAQARRTPVAEGAQWTGLTTGFAEKLLDSGTVSAVVCIGPAMDDPWRPETRTITRAADMASCRGMRMGYAPLLYEVEQAIASGHRKIAVIGIPCQVYAIRSLQNTWDIDQLYVIGTPCSDNTTTERFHEFLNLLDPQPERINYLEFLPNFHVELRYVGGGVRRIPFLQLPIADLAPDFFPLTCRTCVDYSNSLADITVGYMGGGGEDQWLVIRNSKGEHLLELMGDELVLKTPMSRGARRSSVAGFIANTERAAGGLPLRRMPQWLRPIMAKIMPIVGPKGLEFARTRIEMKAAETLIHLRASAPQRLKTMVPRTIWQIMKPYGFTAQPDELMSKEESL